MRCIHTINIPSYKRTYPTKELGNIKSRHWDVYAKPYASIGFNKKPKNVVFSIIKKEFGTF